MCAIKLMLSEKENDAKVQGRLYEMCAYFARWMYVVLTYTYTMGGNI